MLVAVSWSRSAQTNLTEASQLLLYIYNSCVSQGLTMKAF